MTWGKLVTRFAPQAEKVAIATGENLVTKAARYGISEQKLLQLQELGKDTLQKTVAPERLIELHNQGIHGYYSRTVTNPDGSLTKVLSNGDKVVISKNAQGQTVRQVFRNENLMVDDLKTLSHYKVGNKTVNVKEFNRKINKMYYMGQGSERRFVIPQDNAYAFNYKAERVTNADGRLLGMRETEFFPAHSNPGGRYTPDVTYVTKSAYLKDGVVTSQYQSGGWNGYVKQFVGGKNQAAENLTQSHSNSSIYGGRSDDYSSRLFVNEQPIESNKRVVDKFHIVSKGVPGQENVIGTTGGLGQYKPVINAELRQRYGLTGYASTGERLDSTRMYRSVQYNEKGLPLPYYVDVPSGNMSLKDMRLYVQKNHTSDWYKGYEIDYSGPHNFGLGFLDKPYSKT